jgi:hypothetical protein
LREIGEDVFLVYPIVTGLNWEGWSSWEKFPTQLLSNLDITDAETPVRSTPGDVIFQLTRHFPLDRNWKDGM